MPSKRTGRPPGRPGHPEILTPAEQRVLEQLRQGLTNAEIAVRLGVSPDAVKYHVSNMLSKLGLADRRELAAWGPPEERREGAWWLLAPIPGLLRSTGRAAFRPALLAGKHVRLVAGAGFIALAAGITLLLVNLAAPGNGGREPAAPGTPPVLLRPVMTATASPGVTTTASPTPTPPATAADEWAALRARPLDLPRLRPGEPCPVTPMRANSAHWIPFIGGGPAYLLPGSLGWYTDPGYDGATLVRGRRLDRPGVFVFPANGELRLNPGANEVTTRELRRSTGPRVLLNEPGCYGFQADGPGFTQLVVVELSPEPERVWPQPDATALPKVRSPSPSPALGFRRPSSHRSRGTRSNRIRSSAPP